MLAEWLDANVDASLSDGRLAIGRSSGDSARLRSSVFFVDLDFLSLECVGRTRRVVSTLSAAARWMRVRWKFEMPFPDRVSAVGTMDWITIMVGRFSISDLGRHGLDYAVISKDIL